MNVCACIVVMFLNKALLDYGGADGNLAIGAFGIMNRTTMFFVMVVFGVTQGMQPILGFNFGAGQWERVKQTLYKGIWIGVAITTIGCALTEGIPDYLSHLFTVDESLIKIAREGFRIYFICLPGGRRTDCDSEFLSVNRQAATFHIPVAYTPATVSVTVSVHSAETLRNSGRMGLNGRKRYAGIHRGVYHHDDNDAAARTTILYPDQIAYPTRYMQQTLELRLTPEVAYVPLRLTAAVSTRLGIDVNRITEVRIRRRSIDARQRNVMVNLSVDVFIDEAPPAPEAELPALPSAGSVAEAKPIVIVGAGPAGLFAALKAIGLGLRPIVLERGKSVEERSKDMARIARENIVDPESNYCFGEGGAGAYSDGKLYTRSKKRGSVEEVLRLFVAHGASPDILVDAHPHIGTDRLPQVIRAIRESIIRAGGEVHFSTRVDRLRIATDEVGAKRVTGVETADGTSYEGPVILATGHSARDVYRRLLADGIAIEPKGIAVGVRLEHPQNLIDRIQYHNPGGRGNIFRPQNIPC